MDIFPLIICTLSCTPGPWIRPWLFYRCLLWITRLISELLTYRRYHAWVKWDFWYYSWVARSEGTDNTSHVYRDVREYNQTGHWSEKGEKERWQKKGWFCLVSLHIPGDISKDVGFRQHYLIKRAFCWCGSAIYIIQPPLTHSLKITKQHSLI